MDGKYERLIEDEFVSCVRRTLERMKKEETKKPFHEILLLEEANLWSRFERSFSTSFGQRGIEEISRLATLSDGATAAEKQKETVFKIDGGILAEINNAKGHSNWNDSLRHVEGATKTGSMREIKVISDLWWKKDGVENYVSIKTVQPNIDQTTVAKMDCLKLKVFDPNCNVFFGMYYNPFGEERKEYRHTPPMSIFNMHSDPVVLIGEDYWDTLGGPGFYKELLEIARSAGEKTKKMMSGYSQGRIDLWRRLEERNL